LSEYTGLLAALPEEASAVAGAVRVLRAGMPQAFGSKETPVAARVPATCEAPFGQSAVVGPFIKKSAIPDGTTSR
jgi:hypothetical protein